MSEKSAATLTRDKGKKEGSAESPQNFKGDEHLTLIGEKGNPLLELNLRNPRFDLGGKKERVLFAERVIALCLKEETKKTIETNTSSDRSHKAARQEKRGGEGEKRGGAFHLQELRKER